MLFQPHSSYLFFLQVVGILLTTSACSFYPQSRVEKEGLYGNRIRNPLIVRTGNTTPEYNRPSRGIVPIDHDHGSRLRCGVQPWSCHSIYGWSFAACCSYCTHCLYIDRYKYWCNGKVSAIRRRLINLCWPRSRSPGWLDDGLAI